MQTYVPPDFAVTFACLHAPATNAASCGQIGSPKPMCATMPSPKNVSIAVPGTIKKLVGNHKIERLVFLLQRSHRRDRNNAFDAKLLKAVNVGAKIDLGRQKHMPSAVPREKCYLASGQGPQHISIGGLTKRGGLRHFLHIGQTGHMVKPTAANNSNFSLRQESPWLVANAAQNC